MGNKKVQIHELKEITILYEGDVYDLARCLLRLDIARSTPTSTRRHTIHGLANRYAYITNMKLPEIVERFVQIGLPLDATIELDEDVA